MSQNETRELVLSVVRGAREPWTTAEVAKRVHRSASTTRGYLYELVYDGRVARRVEPGTPWDTSFWFFADPPRGTRLRVTSSCAVTA